ncbi:DivIVA domain-containing protein [Micromonospora sp. WMMD980]|uniref:DivIVA domain-containing protein n=1 Tax=Micromonospora sp. WMMD980 TaxID=3016088 RepID=UPI0024169E1B|nr:DivIVA domain-containing protein [Micromonospora sp. WMMD980]MDG4801927.1 DivIVA domain-containing protein [Micromonospora sp. WMMD980]
MIRVTARRLLPYHVRSAVFDRRWRGLDPGQVRDHLDRVADELDRLSRELTTARSETERARQVLRRWQSRHRRCRDPDAPEHR